MINSLFWGYAGMFTSGYILGVMFCLFIFREEIFK